MVKNIENATHVDVVDVEDPGVELQPHGFGLLDWMGELTVSLNEATNLCYTFEFVLSQRKRYFLLRRNHQKEENKSQVLRVCRTHMSCEVLNTLGFMESNSH